MNAPVSGIYFFNSLRLSTILKVHIAEIEHRRICGITGID